MSKLSETLLNLQERAALFEAMIVNESQMCNFVKFGISANINGKDLKGFLTVDHSILSPSRGPVFGGGVLILPLLENNAKPKSKLARAAEFNQRSLGMDPDKAWKVMGLNEGMDAGNYTLGALRPNRQIIELAIARSFVDESKNDPNLRPRHLEPGDQNLETTFKGFNDFVAGLKTDLPGRQITVFPANF